MNFGSHTSLVINGLVGKENESALAHLLTIVNFFDRLVIYGIHTWNASHPLPNFHDGNFRLEFPRNCWTDNLI